MSLKGQRRPPPLALYVHLPWCISKCPYCDFNSHALAGELPEHAYVDALLADWEFSQSSLGQREICSVFFGGGTPSLFSPESIARLMETLRASGKLAPNAEVTLEANPGAADQGRFSGYRQAGVNRLSIGVQSFDDTHLRTLGRAHDGDAARRAVAMAAECFERFSLDLMYALPGQTPEQACADVSQALAFDGGHISCYQLSIEPNTRFYSSPPTLPGDDQIERIEQTVHSALTAHGYSAYEVSNWSREGHQCQHNLNYWRYGDYLGIGAGAHSKLTADGVVRRQVRVRTPASYQKRVKTGNQLAESRRVSDQERMFEFMLNAVRLQQGFELALFEERTGLDSIVLQRRLQSAEQAGLISRNGEGVKTTARGRRYLNAIIREFLPPQTPSDQNQAYREGQSAPLFIERSDSAPRLA